MDELHPYGQWLGVSASKRPVSPYELLGISAVETNPAVISQAARRAADKVKPHLEGKNSRLAKRLLTEIESARLCLLDPAAREKYSAAQLIGAAGSLPKSVTNPDTTGKKLAEGPSPSGLEALLGEELITSGCLTDPAVVLVNRLVPQAKFPRNRKPLVLGIGAGVGVAILFLGAVTWSLNLSPPVAIQLPPEAEPSNLLPPLPAAAGSSSPWKTRRRVPEQTKSVAPRVVRPPVIVEPPPNPQRVADLSGLPRLVELPRLSRLNFGEPYKIATCQRQGTPDCRISLLNPAPLDPDKPITTFESHPENQADKLSWRIDWVQTVASKSETNKNRERRKAVARLTIADDLLFSWLPDAATVPAERLRNCILLIQVNGNNSRIRLRHPQIATPVLVDLEKTHPMIPLTGLSLPELKQLWIEAIQLDGFAGTPHFPAGSRVTGGRDELQISLRQTYPAIQLRLRLMESNKAPVIRVQRVYEDADGEFLPLTNVRVANLARTIPRELRKAEDKLESALDNRAQLVSQMRRLRIELSSNLTRQAAVQLAMIDVQNRLNRVGSLIRTLSDRIPRLRKRVSSIKPLQQAVAQFHQRLTLHFRVLLPVDDEEIEILTTKTL